MGDAGWCRTLFDVVRDLRPDLISDPVDLSAKIGVRLDDGRPEVWRLWGDEVREHWVLYPGCRDEAAVFTAVAKVCTLYSNTGGRWREFAHVPNGLYTRTAKPERPVTASALPPSRFTRRHDLRAATIECFDHGRTHGECREIASEFLRCLSFEHVDRCRASFERDIEPPPPPPTPNPAPHSKPTTRTWTRTRTRRKRTRTRTGDPGSSPGS